MVWYVFVENLLIMKFILINDSVRQRAIEAIKTAPEGYQVVIKQNTRSNDQSSKFHAICGDLAKLGLEWAGKKRTPEEWKVLLVSGHAVATKHEAEVIEGLEGELVSIRESTASMSKARSSSLIEYSLAIYETLKTVKEN